MMEGSTILVASIRRLGGVYPDKRDVSAFMGLDSGADDGFLLCALFVFADG